MSTSAVLMAAGVGDAEATAMSAAMVRKSWCSLACLILCSADSY